jgi:branched-chain amino acid aminotransferase
MSDHIAVMDYANGAWGAPRIVPHENISLSPAASVLHYGQAVFEGMKAFRDGSGDIVLFRTPAHVKRLNKSLRRLAMPEIDEDTFHEMLYALVRTEKEWIPTAPESSLYIRPVVIGTEAFFGVHPSETYSFYIITSPSGPYFSKPVRVRVEETYSRAAPGGIGSTKAAGNYAASLLPAKEAADAGFDQVLWTDSSTHIFIEESGCMNVMFVMGDTLVTPALGDTLLPGLTRDSLLTLAREAGIKTEERKVSISEIVAAHADGRLKEVFGVGTAATVSAIASITFRDKEYTIPPLSETSTGTKLRAMLVDIKTGKAPDTHSWVERVR